MIHLGPLLPTVDPSESWSSKILCTDGTDSISTWYISLFCSDANVAGVFYVCVYAGSDSIHVSIIHHAFNVQVCVCMYLLANLLLVTVTVMYFVFQLLV